jgi:hypothetical protein
MRKVEVFALDLGCVRDVVGADVGLFPDGPDPGVAADADQRLLGPGEVGVGRLVGALGQEHVVHLGTVLAPFGVQQPHLQTGVGLERSPVAGAGDAHARRGGLLQQGAERDVQRVRDPPQRLERWVAGAAGCLATRTSTPGCRGCGVIGHPAGGGSGSHDERPIRAPRPPTLQQPRSTPRRAAAPAQTPARRSSLATRSATSTTRSTAKQIKVIERGVGRTERAPASARWAARPHRSSVTSPVGLLQHTSTRPSPGGSSGAVV